MSGQQLKEIFAANLNYYIEKKGITQTQLANDLNIPKMTMSNWLHANTYPRPDKVQLLADYFGIYRSDLTEERKPENLTPATSEYVSVPILGQIACGDPIYVEENFAGYRTELKDSLPSGNTYYLEAKGNSMEPTIPQGASVLIREQPEVENGEIAAVLLNGDTEATLKRIRKQNGYLMLMPDNNEFDPIIADQTNPCKIIGKAMRYSFDL
ncbi:XRE family transcriptional regulator [Virgibacillus halodenitrificans]|uniref:LexA family protein n=1 Tax=Virgibacillus halodenitrificans TaxID=1482 RepID=UPI001FB5636B|nr:XRE family transcriptional regulator [Virgibacillus halodenitrificans]MCJ0932582.1 XRE family transcriptional regulator [Virgibacillus halodenitrificans]